MLKVGFQVQELKVLQKIEKRTCNICEVSGERTAADCSRAHIVSMSGASTMSACKRCRRDEAFLSWLGRAGIKEEMRDAHSAPSKKSSMRITGKPSHCRVEACAVRGRAGLSNGARKVGAGEDMLGWECNQCAAWFFLGLRGLFLRKQLPLPASRASSPSPSTCLEVACAGSAATPATVYSRVTSSHNNSTHDESRVTTHDSSSPPPTCHHHHHD